MMNIFGVENSEAVEVNGTSLKGYVNATYEELVEKFGEPTYTYGDKTTVEWSLEFECDADNGSLGEDGNVEYVTATIYDWKTDYTPTGEYDWLSLHWVNMHGNLKDDTQKLFTTNNQSGWTRW